jgi:hypothetical protein
MIKKIKNVFYVDIGTMPVDKAIEFVEAFKAQLSKN